MQIQSTAQLHGAQNVSPPHHLRIVSAEGFRRPAGPADEVQFSPQAQALDQIRDLPDVRTERIAQIRQEIAAGIYETPEKLDLALDRLLDEIG